MNEQTIQKVALDSCVVINVLERKDMAQRLRTSLKGKQVRLVLCDVVLGEVRRVRGYADSFVISKVSALLGKKVEVSKIDETQKTLADSVSERYNFCHRGDNMILALCKTKYYTLLTVDRMLLLACDLAGVVAMRPVAAGGI